MPFIEYLLTDGYINRFMVSDILEEPKSFTKATLHGKVNEWLKKGFAIHENPCRKEFVEARRSVTPSLPDKINYKHMYFPFGNIGMEASGFYFVPTYLQRYSTVAVYSPSKQLCRFSLQTCGAATLWVNNELVIDFTPFTRNTPQTTEFEIELSQGDNSFIICLEDLAERDTDYYFRLFCKDIYSLGGLVLKLPAKESDVLVKVEDMLSNIHFDKEVYIDEPGKLYIKNPFNFSLNLEIKLHSPHTVGRLSGSPPSDIQQHVLLPGQEFINISPTLPGFCYLQVCYKHDSHSNIIISKLIGGQFVSSKLLNLNEPQLVSRKKHMINLIAESEMENVFLACAILHQNGDVSKAESIIDAELSGVFLKKDCSDFHFAMILHIYIVYGDKLSTQLKSTIEKAMREYRYWIDEPGDDVMWFFSENHALMFHVCQYIAGGLQKDSIFTASNLSGIECQQKAEKLLLTWFDAFFKEFITEWNSPAYIPVDFLGLAILYMHSNGNLQDKAKLAMDKLCYCLATCCHDGALMTTAGRTYEKELKGVYGAGTTGLLHMLYNTGTTCRVDFALPLALSDYKPPEEYLKFITPTNEPIILDTIQGFENHAQVYLYKNAHGVLSTAINFKPFEKGYQEHIVHCALGKTAQVFVNHPGEVNHYGTGRPGFWAGNGILPKASQDGNTSTLQYDLGHDKINYTHAYIPLSEFDDYIISPKAIAVQKGGGFIIIKSENELQQVSNGPCAGREFISYGQKNTWTITLESTDKYSNLEELWRDL